MAQSPNRPINPQTLPHLQRILLQQLQNAVRSQQASVAAAAAHPPAATHMPPPPAYTPRAGQHCNVHNRPTNSFFRTGAHHRAEEHTHDEEEDDSAEDTPGVTITLNASTVVHGNQNTICIPSIDQTRVGWLISQVLNTNPAAASASPPPTQQQQQQQQQQQPQPQPHHASTPHPSAAFNPLLQPQIASKLPLHRQDGSPVPVQINIQAGVHIVGSNNTVVTPVYVLSALKARLGANSAQNPAAAAAAAATAPVPAAPATATAATIPHPPHIATPIPSPPTTPTVNLAQTVTGSKRKATADAPAPRTVMTKRARTSAGPVVKREEDL